VNQSNQAFAVVKNQLTLTNWSNTN